MHGVGGEAGEHVAEIGKGIDLMAVASRDQAEEDRGGVAAVVGAAEEPV